MFMVKLLVIVKFLNINLEFVIVCVQDMWFIEFSKILLILIFILIVSFYEMMLIKVDYSFVICEIYIQLFWNDY